MAFNMNSETTSDTPKQKYALAAMLLHNRITGVVVLAVCFLGVFLKHTVLVTHQSIVHVFLMCFILLFACLRDLVQNPLLAQKASSSKDVRWKIIWWMAAIAVTIGILIVP